MAKVIIDGNLIDLEMITHITVPKKDWTDEYSVFKIDEDDDEEELGEDWKIWYWGFEIYVIGCKKPIVIYRGFRGEKNYKASGNAHLSIDKMYQALTKRWSPNTLKFDDITVK